MKAILLVNFICFVSATNNNVYYNALSSFLSQDQRATSLLVPDLCWTQYQLTLMTKKLGEAGIRVASSLQKNRPEYFLQHLVIMVDASCVDTEEFVQMASENGYFKSPYRWLILDTQGNGSTMMDDVEMLVDSDVVLMKGLGGGTYEFIEVYKIAKGSELIYTKRSAWNPSRSIMNDSMTNGDIHDAGVLEDYRESKVLSSRRNNLRRHTLTMANVITDSNETRKHMSDRLQLHQDLIAKMSYSVVRICFEMLNSSEKLLFTHTWGYRDKDGNWQGVVDHLIKKEADLGTITLFTLERMDVIDYIAMIGSTTVKFVFRDPPLTYISNIFTLPFTAGVWMAIVVCVLSCSIFLYIASRWEASMSMHQYQLNGTWADVLVLIIGAVLQQGCTSEPRYAAGRTVTLLLFLALTILYSAYSANIVVLLRAPSSSIRTLKDLLNSPIQIGASDFEYNRYFFKKLNEPVRKAIYDKKIAPKGKKPHFYSMKEGVERIRRGLFAFHMEPNPGYRLIQETYQEDEKCDLVEIDYINEIDPWVPGQKRSPFKDLFKINFIKIRESGLQTCIYQRLQVPRPRCAGAVASFSSVGVTDMLPAILAMLWGMLLAPAVMLLEIAHYRLTKIRQRNKGRLQGTPSLVFQH